MTDTTPIGRIVSMLTESGYRALPSPLVIGGLKFDFKAILIGGETSSDLVLVADTAFEQEKRLLLKVEGVARALDISRSRRPLTLVVAGTRPSAATLDAMSRVCRVLSTGTLNENDAGALLRNRLAILLPLTLPATQILIADPLNQLARDASDLEQPVRKLIPLSIQGVGAVQHRLHALIEAHFPDEENDGDVS